jgi:hypothetical protein
VLIADEVPRSGREFQRRCLDKIEEVAELGRRSRS